MECDKKPCILVLLMRFVKINMPEGRMFILLRMLGVIAVMVTVYILILINLQFNLTGYVPSPISSTFENLKAVYRGSLSNKMLNSEMRATSGIRSTLIDIFDGVKTDNGHGTDADAGNKNTSTVDILWYNPPEWADVISKNNMLQSKCTFSNCKMSTNKTDLQRYAAVIYTLTESLGHVPPISRKERNPNQVWIFFFSESPVHHSRLAYRHDNWRNTMNWSMSYNMDADIFRPYGVLETKKIVPERNFSVIFHRKTKLVAWAVSHCGARSKRDDFVSELISYGIQIDIFGKCTNNPYQNSSELRKLIDRDYKFYLGFENSICKDYVTEKFFAYYNLDAVLVVRGGFNYDKYLPNNTFINTAHFSSAKELAAFILSVGTSEDSYAGYLRRKNRYTAKQIFEIPLTPCSMCEKLNNLNENRKTYDDHVSFIHRETCWNPIDITTKSITWLHFVPVILFTFCMCLFLILWKYNTIKLLQERFLNGCSNV